MTFVLIVAIGVGLALLGMTTVAAARAVNQVELYRWITGRESGARAARSLLSGPNRLTAAALGIASAGTLVIGMGLRAILDGLSPPMFAAVTVFLAFPAAVVALRSLPSVVGRRWSEATIKVTVPLISRLAAVFAPVLPASTTVRPRIDLARSQLRRTTGDTSSGDDLTLVSGVLEFTERQVREVMTPRTEVIAVPDSARLDEISRAFVESGFSRLPVFSESLDNIVGMYYAFDLLKLVPGGQLPVRPVTLAPLTRLCADLLFEMQRDRRQVAVVLDEYGGTAGIATLNDLLADLVEETFETSSVDTSETQPQPGVIEVPGSAAEEDVEQQFGVSVPTGVETVGGLLSSAVGRIPVAGERFELAGLEFDIVSATATRVERVTVRRATDKIIRLESAEGK